jgi:RNA-directed DNA polymerase
VGRWLKAGYVEFGQLHETTEGTPQGGVISPLLANVALDGLQAVLFSIKRRKGGRSTGKRVLGYSRYADDCAPRRLKERSM